MTRSSRRNEADRELFRADNPDPRMRPAYSALTHKLRNMSVLDDPSLSMLVIDDMIYHRYLFKEKHPDALWFLLKQVHSYWIRSLGFALEFDEGEALQLEAVQYGDKTYFRQSEKGDFRNLNEDDSGKVKIDLESKQLKTAIRLAIQEHSWVAGFHKSGVVVPKCQCDREFDLFEQWANHARSVIWRILSESSDGERDSGITEENTGEADQADRGESEEQS